MDILEFKEKERFYFTEIEECGKDQKKLFKFIRNLIGSNLSLNVSHFLSAELVVDKIRNFLMS